MRLIGGAVYGGRWIPEVARALHGPQSAPYPINHPRSLPAIFSYEEPREIGSPPDLRSHLLFIALAVNSARRFLALESFGYLCVRGHNAEFDVRGGGLFCNFFS